MSSAATASLSVAASRVYHLGLEDLMVLLLEIYKPGVWIETIAGIGSAAKHQNVVGVRGVDRPHVQSGDRRICGRYGCTIQQTIGGSARHLGAIYVQRLRGAIGGDSGYGQIP